MKQKTPHKHAELIKKWADDMSLTFQFKSPNVEEWININHPQWYEKYEYRIKPEVIRYRVARINPIFGNYFMVASDELMVDGIEQQSEFIEWITDWIEVEI